MPLDAERSYANEERHKLYCYAECRSAECRSAECRGAKTGRRQIEKNMLLRER